jgi:hypothetical protein
VIYLGLASGVFLLGFAAGYKAAGWLLSGDVAKANGERDTALAALAQAKADIEALRSTAVHDRESLARSAGRLADAQARELDGATEESAFRAISEAAKR